MYKPLEIRGNRLLTSMARPVLEKRSYVLSLPVPPQGTVLTLSRRKMKTLIVSVIALFALLVSSLFCFSADTEPCPEKTVFQIPMEKKDLWEALKANAAEKYAVCREHCGGNKVCLDKCRQAYEYRLETEYQKLMHQN